MTDLDVKKKAIPDGYHYDLPTEDEWTSLVGGATLDDAVTSLNGNFRTGTSPVGSLRPNSLGLYDVRGNVMEFVRTDESKPYRVLKGGSWQDRVDVNVRPEFRWYATPDERQKNFGFRVVLRGR
jgi:formylglycine-generating enzyme required for sulfatase activity